MAKKEAEYYKIEGTGKTPQQARAEVLKAYNALIEKLGKKGISADIPVEKQEYSAAYYLPAISHIPEPRVSVFNIESTVGWEEIEEKAEKTAGEELSNYNVTFTIAQYLNLPKKQKEAVIKQRPTACKLPNQGSSLDCLQGLR